MNTQVTVSAVTPYSKIIIIITTMSFFPISFGRFSLGFTFFSYPR